LLQDKNYIRNEDIANSEHLQDDNEDDIYESPVHIAPPPPMPESILNSDCQNSDINDNNDSCEESSSIPKKKGPWVDAHFPLPPPGDLEHPYVSWIIDEVTMDEYMPNYAKQEGFAFTRIKDGNRVRWPCVHAGKYRNRNNLPVEVTAMECRQELQNDGIIPFMKTNQ